jgi:myo-inositol-1(or 4)-monophosphatase
MDPLLAIALRAAEAAAEVHLAHFGAVGVQSATEKAQSDFVTAVDLEAQEAAISVIREAFPHHRILAEEEDGGKPDLVDPRGGRWVLRSWPDEGVHLWIIDPLDGTTNYLHGHPMFASSVAVGRASGEGGAGATNAGLHLRGVLEAGAVVAPRTQERWWASRGRGAWKNGLRIGVSSLREIEKALVGTGFPFKEPELVPRHAQQLVRVLPGSGGVRRGGSAALDLCYLAEGILDAFWEEDYLSPWDTAAGLLILSEAGGVASRMDGSAIDLGNGSLLAANSPGMFRNLAGLLAAPFQHEISPGPETPDPSGGPRGTPRGTPRGSGHQGV